MPQPRYVLAAVLLLALTFAPLTGWPNGQIVGLRRVGAGSSAAGTALVSGGTRSPRSLSRQ